MRVQQNNVRTIGFKYIKRESTSFMISAYTWQPHWWAVKWAESLPCDHHWTRPNKRTCIIADIKQCTLHSLAQNSCLLCSTMITLKYRTCFMICPMEGENCTVGMSYAFHMLYRFDEVGHWMVVCDNPHWLRVRHSAVQLCQWFRNLLSEWHYTYQ